MFSIPHIAILFVVVLVVFGPEKLPELARNFGKIMGEFRRATGELRSTFDGHMRDLEREADLRAARDKAANAAVMTPLPAAGTEPAADPQPPAPSTSGPDFVPASGIVTSNAPYTTATPSAPRAADLTAPPAQTETLPYETKPLPFDEPPAGDASQPEKVNDGRPGTP